MQKTAFLNKKIIFINKVYFINLLNYIIRFYKNCKKDQKLTKKTEKTK